MSTEQHKSGHADTHIPLHEDISFEPRDVRVNIILKFLAYMAVAIVLSFILSLGIYRGLIRYWNSAYTPAPPSRAEAGSMMPPEPMLQGMPGHFADPQQDLRNKVTSDTAANNTLSWVDQKAGIAQIPINDAMDLIVEKGLPAVPAPPAAEKK